MWYNFINLRGDYIFILPIVMISFYYISRSPFESLNEKEQYERSVFDFLFLNMVFITIITYVGNGSISMPVILKLMFRRYDHLSPVDMIEMMNSKAVKTIETVVYQEYLNMNDINIIIKNDHYDINKTDRNGKTIAHLWKYIDSSLKETILSEYKPNLNIQDNDGNTPIMLLFDDQRVLFWDIDEFIKKGSNILIRNKNSQNLLELLELKYNKDQIEETYNMESINHGSLFKQLILSVNNYEKHNYTLFETMFYSNLNIIK